MKLWIDDLRAPPDKSWTVAKSSQEAIVEIWKIQEVNGLFEAVSFDHDLGEDDTTRLVIKFLCFSEWWPLRCYVHTANPVGREWLEGMIERYGPGVSHHSKAGDVR